MKKWPQIFQAITNDEISFIQDNPHLHTVRDDFGNTPLMLAAKYNKSRAVSILMPASAGLCNIYGCNALSLALINGAASSFQLLAQAEKPIVLQQEFKQYPKGADFMDFCLEQRNMIQLVYSIENYKPPSQFLYEIQKQNYTFLKQVIQQQQQQKLQNNLNNTLNVDFLPQRGPMSVLGITSPCGRNLFHYLALNDFQDGNTIKELLDLHVNALLMDKSHQTPLHLAIRVCSNNFLYNLLTYVSKSLKIIDSAQKYQFLPFSILSQNIYAVTILTQFIPLKESDIWLAALQDGEISDEIFQILFTQFLQGNSTQKIGQSGEIQQEYDFLHQERSLEAMLPGEVLEFFEQDVILTQLQGQKVSLLGFLQKNAQNNKLFIVSQLLEAQKNQLNTESIVTEQDTNQLLYQQLNDLINLQNLNRMKIQEEAELRIEMLIQKYEEQEQLLKDRIAELESVNQALISVTKNLLSNQGDDTGLPSMLTQNQTGILSNTHSNNIQQTLSKPIQASMMTDTDNIIDFSIKANDTQSMKPSVTFQNTESNQLAEQDDAEVLNLLAQIQQNEELIQSQRLSKKTSKRVSIKQ